MSDRGNESETFEESIEAINRSGRRWLVGSLGVVLLGLGVFVWLMILEPDYNNVYCNGERMEPGSTCAVVTKLPFGDRYGSEPGAVETRSYEEMAAPDVPGSIAAWVLGSLAVTAAGLWSTVTVVKGWKADLRNERKMWGLPGDAKAVDSEEVVDEDPNPDETGWRWRV